MEIHFHRTVVVREVRKRVDENTRLAAMFGDKLGRMALVLADHCGTSLDRRAVPMWPPSSAVPPVIPLGLSIAVITCRAQLSAADPEVCRTVGPFDLGVVSHGRFPRPEGREAASKR